MSVLGTKVANALADRHPEWMASTCHVVLYLGVETDWRTGDVKLTVPQIAKATRLGRKTVDRALAALRDAGMPHTAHQRRPTVWHFEQLSTTLEIRIWSRHGDANTRHGDATVASPRRAYRESVATQQGGAAPPRDDPRYGWRIPDEIQAELDYLAARQ